MKTKATLFLMMLVLLANNSFSQPAAGRLIAGGSFLFLTESAKEKDNNSTTKVLGTNNFSIQPMVGLFIADNLAVGGGIGYSLISSSRPHMGSDSDQINSSSMINNAPFARYYLNTGTMGAFAEASLGLGFGGSKTKVGNNTVDGPSTTTFRIGFAPGIYYYVTDNIALDAKLGFLGYSRSQEKSSDDSKEIDQQFGLNLRTSTLQFGILFHF
jgi:hypothetical protein